MRSRQKVIDATVRILDGSGFTGVSIAAVAAEAGVSRQTVYSIFGTQQELVSQVLISLVSEVFSDVQAHAAGATTAGEWTAEALVCMRGHVRAHPVLHRLLGNTEQNPLFGPSMLEQALPVVAVLAAPLVRLDPRLAPALPPDVIELILRIGLSVLIFDGPQVSTDGGLRDFLLTWLDPAIDAIVAHTAIRATPTS